MKRNFLSIGGMPEKVNSMNFDGIFRQMTANMLQNFSRVITSLYPNGNYPISEFNSDDNNGVQIVLESDDFETEFFILRKQINGYSLILQTEGSDSEGVFEYDFDEDDTLCKKIDANVIKELEDAL